MSILQQHIEQEFKPRKVGIVEFAESDEFCGKDLYPRQRVLLKLIFLEEMESWEEDVLTDWIRNPSGEVLISPMVRERREWLREHGYQHFGQVNLVGGRRSSKGYVTSFVAAKKMYDTKLLGDPGRYYGIDRDKEIYFSSIAASLDQSKKFQFSDIVSTVSRCKAMMGDLGKIQEEGFRVHTPADQVYMEQLKREGVKVARDWAKLRAIPLAANADTIRGSTTMFTVFDEMAFMLPGESRSSADECYKAAEPALAQFGRAGMIMCNSSPYTKIGRFYEEVQKGLEIENGQPVAPAMLTFQFPSWELYRGYEKDPGRRFKNAIMVSPDWNPDDLSEDDRAKQKQEQIKEKANPEAYKVERRGQWAEVIDAYLDPMAVDRAFRPEYMNKLIRMASEGSYVNQYVMHCDPSSTTAGFGFAVAHTEEFPDPNFPDGMARHVVFDLVKRWNPKDFPGSTIDYMKVQAEIANYIDWFRPYEITFDQFNSAAPIQWLRQELTRRNISQTRVYEVTATKKLNWDRSESFKTALNLGLVHIPPDCIDSEYASQELKFLQEKNGRVDKQTIGPVQTKDIADCIMECTYKLIGSMVENYISGTLSSMRMQGGAQGGYQIGGREPGGPQDFNDFYGNKRGAPNSRTWGINPDKRKS